MTTESIPQPPSATNAIALGLRYGPNAGVALQRSQYLADALRNLQASGGDIRTPLALGGNLLAEAITAYGKKRADKEAISAYGRDRQSLADSALAGLGPDPSSPVAPPPIAPANSEPPVQPAPQQPPVPVVPAQAPTADLPRGLRNNNPLNVTTLPNGQTWNGQTGTDGNYATFGTPQDGWNAADKNLTSYALKHGINTPDAAVSRWSPGAPADYAKQVAAALKVAPGQTVDFTNPDIRRAALTAMAGFENGQLVPFGQGGAPAGPQPQAPQQLPIPQPAQPAPAPVPSGPPAAGGAAPVLSPQSGAAPAIPHGMVTPAEVALTKQLMADPRTYDQGLAMAYQLRERQAKVLAPPDKMMWDAQSGRVVPIPGTETTQLQGLTPSDAAQRDAFGNISHAAIPGMQGAAPAGTIWDGHGYVAAPQPQFGQGANGGGAASGGGPGTPRTLASLVQKDPVTGELKTDPRLNTLTTMRDQWRASPQYKEYTEGLSALGGLTNAVRTATKNNGVLDTAAVDSLWKTINPSTSVRQGNMQLFLSHLGVPQELEGLVLKVTGNGYVTPETLQQALDVMHAYVTARQADVQTMAQADSRIAKGFGVDDLGEDVSPLPEMPKIQFGQPAAAPPNPAAAQLQDLYRAGKLSPQQVDRARKLGVIK